MDNGKFFEALIENISDVLAILDPDGTTRFKSANVRHVFGWDPEELIGRSGLELIHPDDRDAVFEQFAVLVAATGGRAETECRYQHRDGSYRWVSMSAINRTDDPVINGVLVRYYDVSERKRLELESERRRLYLEEIVASAPDAIITLDPEHRVVEWNPGAAELFGYSAAEAEGRNLDDLVAGADPGERRRAAEYSARVMRHETVPHTESTRFRKDGTPVAVILADAPILMEGQPIGIVATYKDITEQKEAERRVRALLEEKDVILQEIRHRIRNDLALVASLLSVQAGQSESPEVVTALNEAQNRIQVIHTVYDRLEMTQTGDTVDLDALLSGVVTDLQRSTLPGDVTVTYNGTGTAYPTVTRRAVAIGIMVNELITNAVKYAFPGTAVPANSEPPATRPRITVSFGAAPDRLTIGVCDNGIGVPAEVAAGIRRGYGLTVIDALLTQHQGYMEIRRNDGTDVKLVMPVFTEER
ncbi:MAG: PAS domain S-box protein [Spirochaeta sp.]|jgi:PAS domain S-box-containing protein|nr:PAS domain S-box protein [Spirochaeta sp.]